MKGLLENHRQSASRDAGAVFAAGENSGDLRVEALRDPVTNGTRRWWNETCSPSGIDELYRIVVDVDTCRDITHRKIAVDEGVGYRFADRVIVVNAPGPDVESVLVDTLLWFGL